MRLSIIIFSYLYSHGGGRETWLNNFLISILDKKFYNNIDIYCIEDEDASLNNRIAMARSESVNLISIKLPKSGGKIQSLKRIAAYFYYVNKKLRAVDARDHVVIAVGSFYEAMILCSQRFIRVKSPTLIAWIRGVWAKEIYHRHSLLQRGLIIWLEKTFLKCSDKLISNGFDTKEIYEQILGRSIEAIPNGVDIERFASPGKRIFDSALPVIAYVGRLSEEKGLRHFLSAVDCYLSAPSINPPVKFEVVGDGPLRNLVEEYVERKNTDRVTYLGVLSNKDMPNYLSGVDASVCLTYSKESGGGGVSNSLLELMASRTLIIAWDSRVYRQVVDDSQAIFVEEGAFEDLSRAFVKAASSKEYANSLVDVAENEVRNYTFEAHVERYLKFVHEC